jgi:death-on-curing protein
VNPTFLGLSEVLEIHRDQIDRYGGDQGIRDLGLFQSALAMPATGFGGRFVHGDLYEMAAAYLFHIIQNHPFVDGNKRTGAVAALVFLALNDVVIEAEEDDFERVIRAVAEGEAAKATVSEFFRKHAQEGQR